MDQLETFSKDKTQELKGIAILMMLFLHLFSSPTTIGRYVGIPIGSGETVERIITSICNPVYAFTFLSGYGLWISYKNRKGAKNHGKRLYKLFLKYWVSLLIFVPIAHLWGDNSIYPGSWRDILENATSIRTSYNGTIWFLFPYSCLVVLSAPLFHYIKRLKRKVLLSIILLNTILCSLLLHFYGSFLITHRYLYQLEHVYELLIPFLIGAFWAKEIKYGNRTLQRGGMILIVLIALGFLIRNLSIGLFSPVYMLSLFICISFLRLPRIWSRMFRTFGQKATGMWFVHAYFCWYIFSDWLYAFKYSIIIYASLVAVSYVSACVVDVISDSLNKLSLHFFNSIFCKDS